jgi:hypothetical protein
VSSYLDDVLCVVALAAINIAVALLLFGFAPEITAWVTR